MDSYIIRSSTSYRASDATIALIKDGFKVTRATIDYNLKKGLPPIQMEDSYPLILEGKYGGFPSKIKVWAVTAGYGGTGPHDLLKILNAAGFEISDTSPFLTNLWARNNRISITVEENGSVKNNLE